MKSHTQNPKSNKLPTGLSEEQLSGAVNQSGYPLQVMIAGQLRSRFRVQEEWSYLDRDSQGLRALDILAESYLYDPVDIEIKVRPSLTLLVECKQSELPYVFFKTEPPHWLPHFPIIAGLPRRSITIRTDDEFSTWTYSIQTTLDLSFHPFVTEPLVFSTTFSKAVRKGKNVELSGAEPFNAIILPIIKASEYFSENAKPKPTYTYFDCHLVVGLCVIDAPMVVIEQSDVDNNLEMIPWVRVLREEVNVTYTGGHHKDSSELYAIDIVHKDYLDSYMNQHLLPFAYTFAQRILKHQAEVSSSQAFVSGMGKHTEGGIEQKLHPVGIQRRTFQVGKIMLRIAMLPWHLAIAIKRLVFRNKVYGDPVEFKQTD
jgi:hypothetical protein